jgi:hypothetical protein
VAKKLGPGRNLCFLNVGYPLYAVIIYNDTCSRPLAVVFLLPSKP